jgi:two-component system response regulator YesN
MGGKKMYTVLIIDDEPWSREIIKALGSWESLKLQVIGEAQDGTEGIRLIRELKPNIVVTDMRMPGLEGVELLKTMKEEFPCLKVIVMSGYNDFIYLKQAIRSRAIEYLLKPINQEELNTSLSQCVIEIEAENKKERNITEALGIFSEDFIFEKYLAYRQQVLEYFLVLNKPAVLNTFERLQKFLEDTIPNIKDEDIIIKIVRDYIFTLQELMVDKEIDFIKKVIKDNAIDQAFVACKSISQAVSYISTIYGKAIDLIEESKKNRNKLNIKEVENHIKQYYKEPISLDTIAHHFFISREHLSRIFKVYTGENISEYIIRIRMEKARALILEDKVAIKHVAQMTGYNDIAYFYRVFKKHFGITPGELAKSLKQHQ